MYNTSPRYGLIAVEGVQPLDNLRRVVLKLDCCGAFDRDRKRATEPSPFDKDRPTLLGAAQWKWLRRELKASTAPFKVLACGMIWNGAVRPGKKDHWGTYPHERDGLFDFIGKEKITGVVLVGGDIHRTRVLRHKTTKQTGYDVPELITSPAHASVIANANVPNMVGQISTLLASANLNIADLLNKSRGDIAYSIIDVDGNVDESTLQSIRDIEGVLSVRHLSE